MPEWQLSLEAIALVSRSKRFFSLRGGRGFSVRRSVLGLIALVASS
jgi:hypothetical protein